MDRKNTHFILFYFNLANYIIITSIIISCVEFLKEALHRDYNTMTIA